MAKRFDKKIMSWAFYDFGNSAFSTTVMAGFFPIFFKSYWSDGASAIDTTARLGSSVSLASFLIAILTPFLGAMVDLKESKKKFLLFFVLIGVFSTAWLSWVGRGGWVEAAVCYGIGMMAFSAAGVFYDSLLPSLGKGTQLDYASSLGFSLGYLGGGILFLINVLMYLKPELFGIETPILAVQLSFLSVAVWWLLFTFPLLFNVPEPVNKFLSLEKLSVFQLTMKSIRQLKTTFSQLYVNKNLFIFILAYWLYIDGVYTVMTMAVDYGVAIGFQAQHLISALLITQFIGFPFTYIFGTLTRGYGCKKPILVCIGIYIIGVLAATQMSNVIHFYMLATMIGMVQGGVQSLSRSLFANMIPENASGEYFGFFNLIGKFASIFGPLIVAIFTKLTNNSAMGIGGISVLFIIGGLLLTQVKEPNL